MKMNSLNIGRFLSLRVIARHEAIQKGSQRDTIVWIVSSFLLAMTQSACGSKAQCLLAGTQSDAGLCSPNSYVPSQKTAQ